jgi:hypothetical protein
MHAEIKPSTTWFANNSKCAEEIFSTCDESSYPKVIKDSMIKR